MSRHEGDPYWKRSRRTVALGGNAPPHAGPGEVRIRVVATAVNRADLMQRKGLYPPPPGASPILGLEASGIIDEVGEGVTQWRCGDAVCALLSGGGYAEYVVVPQQQLLPVPEGLSLIESAALPEVYATATLNLHFLAKVTRGVRVLLHAGASGVGTASIQLCREWGAPVFVTAGSDEKIALCVSFGAAAGCNRHEQDFVSEVNTWTQGKGVDVILDPVGAAYLNKNQAVLAPDGCMISIGLLSGRRAELDMGRLLIKRQRIMGSTLRSRSLAKKGEIIQYMTHFIWPLFERKRLQPIICRTFPITDADEAHTLVTSNTTTGKVVLTIPD